MGQGSPYMAVARSLPGSIWESQGFLLVSDFGIRIWNLVSYGIAISAGIGAAEVMQGGFLPTWFKPSPWAPWANASLVAPRLDEDFDRNLARQ